MTPEEEAKAQAMISTAIAQRDQAANAVIELNGEVAVLRKKLEEATKAKDGDEAKT